MKSIAVIAGLVLASLSAFGSEEKSPPAVQDCNMIVSPSQPSNLDSVLQKVKKASSELQTLESNISYLTIQDPDIVESTTLQTGKLYYQKSSEHSQLRIRFENLQQDDFPPEKNVEDYYFDGVWLTKVDYKLKQISKYQQTPEDKPVDVFELINSRFPLFGLSGTEAMEKDFNITRADSGSNDPNEPIQLVLDAKKDSKYSEDYKKVEIWVDKSTYLPRRIRAYKAQGDIDDIRFSDIYINKKLKNACFTIETPPGFRQNIEALETDQ